MSDSKLKRGSGLSSSIDRLASLIPGYRGYKAREAAREDDKLLRARVCFDLATSLHQLKKHKAAVLELSGPLSLRPWTKFEKRLQELEVKFRSTSGFYDGFMSASSNSSSLQDRLIKVDETCVERAAEVAEDLKNSARPADLDPLSQSIQLLEDAWSDRDSILSMRGDTPECP